MVFRFILRYFANNEQLIQRMAESYPMRRAAQLVVSLMYRTKGLARERGLDKFTSADQLKAIADNLKKQLEEKGKMK